MKTVTKKDIIAELSDVTGIRHSDSAHVVESFMELVVSHLAAGDEITLRGFGTFDLRVAKGKIGRNPKQPEVSVMIPDRCVVRFKPSKELKARAAGVPTEQVLNHRANNGNGLNGASHSGNGAPDSL